MNDFISNCLLFIGLLLGPLLLLILMGWFAISAFLDIKHKLVRSYQLRSTPCGRCLYYTGCKELACAVHPCQVLTKAAQDCQDFTLAESPLPPSVKYHKS